MQSRLQPLQVMRRSGCQLPPQQSLQCVHLPLSVEHELAANEADLAVAEGIRRHPAALLRCKLSVRAPNLVYIADLCPGSQDRAVVHAAGVARLGAVPSWALGSDMQMAVINRVEPRRLLPLRSSVSRFKCELNKQI